MNIKEIAEYIIKLNPLKDGITLDRSLKIKEKVSKKLVVVKKKGNK